MTFAVDNGLPGLDRVGIWFNDPANWWGPGGLLAHAREHLLYTFAVVALAALIGIPVGLVIGHTGRGTTVAAGMANTLRAVPTLGLLIVVLSPHIPVQGGWGTTIPAGSVPYLVPALIVLLILAVPPILTSSYAGVQALDPATKDAAAGTGMTPLQVILKVELPCALPLIISGLRSAVLQVMASLTVAAYAPLIGGLGRFITDGNQNLGDLRYGYPAMVAGGISVAVLALAVDGLLQLVQRLAVSPGLTPTSDTRRPSPMTSQSPAQNSAVTE
ncbi:ABC transporter permease [Streptomyces mirabilis]|uniref:ABC transporter permease n=1 Tax=Streptomyces mirabilis TaxID=68239 RepID=UPI003322A657